MNRICPFPKKSLDSALAATAFVIPPPRRRQKVSTRGLHAVELLPLLGLLPLATRIVVLALVSHRRLPDQTRPRGCPKTYADASSLRVALVGRLWPLSPREVGDWLTHWPALASACGLPPERLIHPAPLRRRVRS